VGQVKDLDYDELDKAVNSLIGGNPRDNRADNQPRHDDVKKTTPSQSTVRTLASSASPLVARRSTGQFMDVVHPSSNMRPSLPLIMPERKIGLKTVASMPAKLVDNPVLRPASAMPAPTPAANNSWPDPIDYHANNRDDMSNNSQPESHDDTEGDDIDKISDDINKTLGQTPEDPSESPFISGAKVDKRPLGAFSAESSDMANESSLVEASSDQSDRNTINEQTNDVDAPLPAELQSDLLSIESSGSASPMDSSISSAPTAPSTNMPVNNQLTDNGSISKQYQEQPSSGDQNTGAIYDTDAYHKTLLLPAKTKSDWMWVLWIFILLIIGAGAGAAVYFFVLPQLHL
jgi:hypothetical protein